MFPDPAFNGGPQRAVADEHEADRLALGGDRCKRVEEQIMPLDWQKVGDAADDDHMRIDHAKVTADGDPFCRRRRRTDDHPVADDPNLRRVHAADLDRMLARRRGVGDDNVGEPSHQRRNAVLERPEEVLGIDIATSRDNDRSSGDWTHQRRQYVGRIEPRVYDVVAAGPHHARIAQRLRRAVPEPGWQASIRCRALPGAPDVDTGGSCSIVVHAGPG